MSSKSAGIKNKFKSFKEMIGIEADEDESLSFTGMEDVAIEENLKPNFIETPSPRIDSSVSASNVDQANNQQYQTVFVDPKSFADCKKIANYIKNDKMVTLNLEYLDTKDAQRIMDFLSGAMSIKEARFIEISKKVYTSIPKSVKFHYDGKTDLKQRAFLDINND
ncbi:MAG: cell division protein SepF [Cetobacterium sp.]|uniref:cell division protein SepF n=1 Tax=unclassified Cetobacterium TaxID=2630983 RepID=UPI00163CEB1E|nr:cell division protein SepF [Cetobacterium sp. 2A]MBC2856515.1 cell division protein SepF [Cetobacterium sp. 2A]